MLETELETEILQHALVTPIKFINKLGSVGSIYDSQGQPHINSLLSRSYKQVQFAEQDYHPKVNQAKLRVKKGIYGGRIVDHYGHFLLETLARAWAFNSYPDEDVYFHLFSTVKSDYSFSDLRGWQKDLLIATLIKPERVHFITELTYFNELIVPVPGYVISNYCHPQQAQALTEIGQRLKPKATTQSQRKIWLSRSGLKKARIAGEQDFEAALQHEGFEIIHPERLPVGEQIQLFEGKNVIAGFTGSAFHTLILAESKESKLLHFSRIKNISQNYATCVQAKGIEAEYYDFFIKKGKQKSISGNVLQNLEKVWQVLHQQGLVKAETYNDSDLELKLQELDEETQKNHQKIKKISLKQSNSKSAKKLFIHVGQHKTGSSFIQSCLAKNRTLLENQEIQYPFFKTMENAANGFISSGNGRLILENKTESWEVNDDCTSLLFSGENLYINLINGKHLNTITELQQKFNIKEISILLFIRDPIEHASSFYQQEIKRGGATFSIEEYFESYDTPLRIENFLMTFSKIKNVSLHVFNYSIVKDKLTNIVEQWLGISENSLSPPEASNINRSLTFAELEFQRHLNAVMTRSAIVSDQLCNQLPTIKADTIIPSVEVQSTLLNRLKPVIDRVNTLIPADQGYRCTVLPESKNINSPLVLNTEQLRVIAESLGRTISRLNARNEKLQVTVKNLQSRLGINDENTKAQGEKLNLATEKL